MTDILTLFLGLMKRDVVRLVGFIFPIAAYPASINYLLSSSFSGV